MAIRFLEFRFHSHIRSDPNDERPRLRLLLTEHEYTPHIKKYPAMRVETKTKHHEVKKSSVQRHHRFIGADLVVKFFDINYYDFNFNQNIRTDPVLSRDDKDYHAQDLSFNVLYGCMTARRLPSALGLDEGYCNVRTTLRLEPDSMSVTDQESFVAAMAAQTDSLAIGSRGGLFEITCV